MKRFAQVVGDRIDRHIARRNLGRQSSELVRETARGPARNCAGHCSVMGGVACQCRPISLISVALLTPDERSSELGGGCTKLKCGGNPGPIHDAPRRDDW